MATELDALLEAIREAPADDLPRLALSDWCMEQTEPAMRARGEMIQLRARAATLPPASPERGQMERRVQDLRQQFEKEWLGVLESLAWWDFERGMILIEVRSGAVDRRRLEQWATEPAWKWVIGLKGVLLTSAEVGQLARSPLLESLTSLDLSNCELGFQGVRALTQANNLGYLASLKLGYTRCGDEGAAALAESANLTRLTVLALCNNAISSGARSLADSTHLERLTHLDLSRNPLGDEGTRSLAHSPNLPALTHLALSSCNMGDRGGSAFADSTQRQALQVLDLTDNRFGKSTRLDLEERYGSRVLLSER